MPLNDKKFGEPTRTDKILEEYNAKLSELKKERDKIASDFIGFLREKKLEEIKRSLNK